MGKRMKDGGGSGEEDEGWENMGKRMKDGGGYGEEDEGMGEGMGKRMKPTKKI